MLCLVAKPYMAGYYICEYGGTVRKKVEDRGDLHNVSLDTGCYSLDAVYNNEML